MYSNLKVILSVVLAGIEEKYQLPGKSLTIMLSYRQDIYFFQITDYSVLVFGLAEEHKQSQG